VVIVELNKHEHRSPAARIVNPSTHVHQPAGSAAEDKVVLYIRTTVIDSGKAGTLSRYMHNKAVIMQTFNDCRLTLTFVVIGLTITPPYYQHSSRCEVKEHKKLISQT